MNVLQLRTSTGLIPILRVIPSCLSYRQKSGKVGRADVVVGGGGIVGTSIAYHLAKHGKYVHLLERDCIGLGGATSLNAGLVTAPIHWQDPAKQFMAKYSMDLYAELAETSNFRYNRCGRLYLTSTPEGEVSLRRMFSRATIFNEAAQMYDSPEEMQRWFPKNVKTDDIKLAVFSPNDVALDPIGLCQAMADLAREYGVHMVEQCTVEEVLTDKDLKVTGVRTNKGIFETDCYVDATGIWCGTSLVNSLPENHITIASHPATYTYLSTRRLACPEAKNDVPIFTHVDEKTFLRMDESHTLCGSFTQEGTRALNRPRKLGRWSIPAPDWDRFYPALGHFLSRCSALGEIDCGELICSAEAYTPDKNPIIGETAQVPGYYVATGFSGQGLALAGGCGELIAQLICGEMPQVDFTRLEVTRFINLHANSQYLMERVPEVAGLLFTNSYEYHQYQTARNLRASPVFHQLKRAGAVFGEVMGYERPLWFEKRAKDSSQSFYSGQFSLIGRPEWFKNVHREYEACRERVAVIDLSSFAKFEFKGQDTVEFLQRLCSANIDVKVGSTVYTGMQNERGGYVTDCTLSRLGPQHFFITAPTVQQLRFKIWINKWLKELGHKVHLRDVTGQYTALDVLGPSSRVLMQKLTDQSMSPYDFPSFSIREINIGMATGIRAMRLTHTGELGWVMYIPNEVAQNVYERLLEHGRDYGILHAGYYAFRQLRIEKFFVYWGQDIFPNVTPLECGRAFRVDFQKDFIGKEALVKQLETGIHKRYVQLLIDDHDLDVDPWPQGGELIYRYGIPSGRTTSAAFGYTLGCQVCIGYIENDKHKVTNEFINKGRYEVDIAGKFFPVRVNLSSPTLPMISSEHTDHYRPTQ